MIDRSGGGDFLVIRTSGTDAYNNDVFDLTTPDGLRADSVATLIVTSRAASFDPFVVRTIRSAEALWIAGGDQACTSPCGAGRRSPTRSTTWWPAGCRSAARARAWP